MIFRTYGAGTNTLSISRIKLKLHYVQNLSLTQKLGKRGRFAKVSFKVSLRHAFNTKRHYCHGQIG